jgi:putative ABC transport system permease protein
MNLLQVLRVALRALFRNKMRSFLTMLGMVIGVAAVIAMVMIGDGAKARVEASFSAMGSNMLMVTSGASGFGGAHGGSGSQPTLTWDDLRAIQTEVPSIRYAAPMLRTNAQVLSEDQNWSTSIQGTSPDFLAIRSWAVTLGAPFTESDVTSGTKVAMLGQTVVAQLFGEYSNPVGQQIRVKNVPFTVVGVLEKKGQSAFGPDIDDVVVIPYTTFLSKIQGGLRNYLSGQIAVSAMSEGDTDRVITQVTGLLRDRHRIRAGADDDFSIRNMAEIANASEQGMDALTKLLAAIAAISLLVGGIGIMNIMLVSVTERTREIGVRMAVGARARDILLQFLAEALTLAVVGGIIGILLGLGVGWRVSLGSQAPMVFRPEIVILAVGFSGLVGVVFGLYPAHKASRLDPIQALRFE